MTNTLLIQDDKAFLVKIEARHGTKVRDKCWELIQVARSKGETYSDLGIVGQALLAVKGAAFQESVVLNATPFNSQPDS